MLNGPSPEEISSSVPITQHEKEEDDYCAPTPEGTPRHVVHTPHQETTENTFENSIVHDSIRSPEKSEEMVLSTPAIDQLRKQAEKEIQRLLAENNSKSPEKSEETVLSTPAIQMLREQAEKELSALMNSPMTEEPLRDARRIQAGNGKKMGERRKKKLDNCRAFQFFLPSFTHFHNQFLFIHDRPSKESRRGRSCLDHENSTRTRRRRPEKTSGRRREKPTSGAST